MSKHFKVEPKSPAGTPKINSPVSKKGVASAKDILYKKDTMMHLKGKQNNPKSPMPNI